LAYKFKALPFLILHKQLRCQKKDYHNHLLLKALRAYSVSVLADKAISPNKEVLIKNLISRQPITTEKKRLILKWLDTNYTNAADFLKNIDDNGIPIKNLIIGVSPKEREMKNEPRLTYVISGHLALLSTNNNDKYVNSTPKKDK
ncbi:hypothetical protein BLOT_006103, partial [Blomia tropicalis]